MHSLYAQLFGVRVEQADVFRKAVPNRAEVLHDAFQLAFWLDSTGFPLVIRPPLALALFDLLAESHVLSLTELR